VIKETEEKIQKQRLLTVGRVFTPLALSCALLLAACGSDDNASDSSTSSKDDVDCATGSIIGAGSTFVQPIAQQWVKDYQTACAGSTINYRGVGSGTGINQFTQGQADFAASDVALKADEKTAAEGKHGKISTLPWAAGAIAIEYKLTGVEAVRLSPASLAGIYAGTIKSWDDAAIVADNPGRRIPAVPIQVVHRSDGSGTTAVFTEFLTANAPEVWKAGSGKEITWPVGQGQKGSDGVTALVKQIEGAIGYAELSFAKANGLPTAAIQNVSGEYVTPDDASGVTAALAESTVGDDMEVRPNYKPQSKNAYPIASFTYVVTPTAASDAAKAKLMSSFVKFAVTNGQQAAPGLGYAPLPEDLAKRVGDAAVALAGNGNASQ
jgi:phosphate transport system substrate-binding protein